MKSKKKTLCSESLLDMYYNKCSKCSKDIFKI